MSSVSTRGFLLMTSISLIEVAVNLNTPQKVNSILPTTWTLTQIDASGKFGYQEVRRGTYEYREG